LAKPKSSGIVATDWAAVTPAPPPPEPGLGVEDFAPPRPKAPWIIGAALAALVALIVWLVYFLPNGGITPTPTATPTEVTATEDAWGEAFEMGSSTGRWEITDYEFTDDGLEVCVHIISTKGWVDTYFHAMDNKVADIYTGYPSYREPSFVKTELREGEEYTGWLHFTLYERVDTTVVLADSWGSQAAAIVIKA
jgi:hypothetical protein